MQIIEPISETHDINHPEFYRAVGKLIVSNLDKTKDAGIYKCMVEDNSYNRNSATLNVVKILSKYPKNTIDKVLVYQLNVLKSTFYIYI